MLFSDATILTESPPLRARWSQIGEQAKVQIKGNRAWRVVLGALNVSTVKVCLERDGRWNQQSFQGHLRHTRSQWWGWILVLFVARGSPHTARRSRKLVS